MMGSKYYKDFLHKAADKVFFWWEENKFEDEGFGTINKVCQFSDWVDEVDNESLATIGGINCDYDNGIFVRQLRATINKGINKWLEGAN